MCEAVTTYLVGSAAVEGGAAATSGIIGTAGALSPWVTVGTSALGLGMSAVGAYQQNAAQNAQMKYQAGVANNNAITAENEANYARQTAERNEEAQKRKTLEVIGTQRAAEGASGAVVDNGSFMDVTLDTAERGTVDAMALLREGDLAAWRYENQAANFKTQAGLYDASQKDPTMAIGGSLLSGAGQIGMNYYRMTNGKAV